MRWISAGAVLNSCSWTIVTTAQLGMGLQLAPTQEHLVQMTALMRSAAQLSSFFVLPACGALSDWVGRKPVLVARSCIVFLFSGLVALSPSYPVFLLHRFVSNFTHHLTDAMTHAAVADLYQGQQLASATAGLKSQMGLAMLAGPALGGRLAERSFSLCFALSSLCGLANVALFGVGMSETRDETAVGSSQRGAFTKVSPLSFLALFRTRTLAKLTLALGVSEMCDGTHRSMHGLHTSMCFYT
jgi:MFS family permease